MQVQSLSMTLFCFALVTLILHETYGNVVIFRGENDRFTNMFGSIGCNKSKAVCFDDNCAQCQCLVNQTFVQTRGNYGECVSDDLIVYATSYEATFRLQHINLTENCLYQQTRNTFKFVLRSDSKCDEKERKFRWLWTNFGQLLHWETLECMTDDYRVTNGNDFVVLKKCDTNEKQSWECAGDDKEYIHRHEKQTLRYMDYGEFYDYVTVSNAWPSVAQWRRYDTQKEVCSQAVGCEMFADASSLIILNKTKCEGSSECSGEKEINLTKRGCSILPNKIQYLHNDTWNTLEIKKANFEITADKPFLKWNLSETPKSWRGLIVKVQFKCGITSDPVYVNEHCVVIKYTGTFKGFDKYDEDDEKDDGDEEDGDGGDGDEGDGDEGDGDNKGEGDGDNKGEGDGDNKGEGDGDNKGEADGDNKGEGDGDNKGEGNNDRKSDGDKTNKDNTNADQESNESGKNNTKTIIIVVCVLVVLVITGVIIFVIYKQRHRFVRSWKGNTESKVGMKPKEEEYANALNPLYPTNTNQSAQAECALYESAPEHVYHYVHADHKTTDPPPQDLTYDYAAVDGPMNKNDAKRTGGTPEDDEELQHDKEEQTGEIMDTSQSTNRPPHKYHVLEEP